MALTWQPVDLRSDAEAHDFHDADPGDVLAHVAALLDRPEWHRFAKCRGGDKLSTFFPRQGQPIDEARTICDGCTVTHECLAAALEHGANVDVGVWGGTSARQRRELRRTRAETAA